MSVIIHAGGFDQAKQRSRSTGEGMFSIKQDHWDWIKIKRKQFENQLKWLLENEKPSVKKNQCTLLWVSNFMKYFYEVYVTKYYMNSLFTSLELF